jgi:MFS family permease
MIIFVGGIIGAQMAPSESLATLPIAIVVVGTALATIPVSLIMKKFGRKTVFVGISLYTSMVMLLAAYAIHLGNFYFFCGALSLLGFTVACVMQFRFAAMESVRAELMPKAASYVLIGGIAAAFIRPEIGVGGQYLTDVAFVGSFILLSGLFLICAVILGIGYHNTQLDEDDRKNEGRPLRIISKQSVFWVAVLGAAIGYSLMSFIMTATPISMHVMDGHTMDQTKFVIQSHISAMFLPSLFSGWLISKLGIPRIMYTGVVVFAACIVIAFLGHDLINYWVSLVLLGIGWNFLFVGSTVLLPQTYRTSERFKVQAFNDFTVFSTQAVASLSAGWLVISVGWENMLIVTIPILLIQVLALKNWKRKAQYRVSQ